MTVSFSSFVPFIFDEFTILIPERVQLSSVSIYKEFPPFLLPSQPSYHKVTICPEQSSNDINSDIGYKLTPFIQRRRLYGRESNIILVVNNPRNWPNRGRLIVRSVCYLQKISSYNFFHIFRRQNCASALFFFSRFASSYQNLCVRSHVSGNQTAQLYDRFVLRYHEIDV